MAPLLHLRWRVPGVDEPVLLSGLTIRLGMQLATLSTDRLALHVEYVRKAYAYQVMGILVHDSIPEACWCGAYLRDGAVPNSLRLHHFWHCQMVAPVLG